MAMGKPVASRRTKPNPSFKEGRTRASAKARREGISCRKPRNLTDPPSPNSAARERSSRSSGPSPTSRRRARGSRFRTDGQA
jgi:hypothetical protein